MENLKEVIYKLETDLLKPEIRSSKEELDKLISNDFIEYGSSGLVYDKNKILERLPNSDSPTYILYDFDFVILSEGTIQTRFKTDKIEIDGTKTSSLRSSIWRKTNDKWQILFHQGTLIK